MAEQYEILTRARFYLELSLDGSQDQIDGYFSECQGLKRSLDLIEMCEVTPQKWGSANASKGLIVRTKLPGNTKCENIVLRRGLTISETFWSWLSQVDSGNWSQQRRDGDLAIYDQAGEVQARFRFYRSWPLSYKISDVQVESSDFEIEEITLAVEDFKRVQASGQES